MGMPSETTGWTVAMVQALPDDGKRYEVIDGELLVTPAPTWRHQRAAFELAVRIREFLGSQPVAEVIVAPADVQYDERTLVEPDLFVVPLVEGRKPRDFREAGRLLLAVEILSLSTARADRHTKRRLYQRQGVPEYWIVDLDARLIERWRPEDVRPEILTERIEWRPLPAAGELEIDLSGYFADMGPSIRGISPAI